MKQYISPKIRVKQIVAHHMIATSPDGMGVSNTKGDPNAEILTKEVDSGNSGIW